MTTRERPILFSGEMVKAILEGRKTQTRRILKFPHHRWPIEDASVWVKSVYPDGGGNWIGWSHDAPDLGQFTKKAYPNGKGFPCPYGRSADRLWVRETFVIESNFNVDNERAYPPPFSDGRPIRWEEDKEYGRWWRQCHYRATDPDPELYEEDCGHDHDGPCTHWRPSIHMPRWASRITLEIVGVKVERLQDITEDDAKTEGAEAIPGHTWRPLGSTEPPRPLTLREYFKGAWDAINSKRGFPWESNPWVWVIAFRQVKA